MSKPISSSDTIYGNNAFTQSTRNEQRKSDQGKNPPARQKATKPGKSDVRKDK